jgi:hypothetical protein
MSAAEKITKLMEEVAPSERRSAHDVCDAFLRAAEKRDAAELKEVSGAFRDAGFEHLAALCELLADRLTIH